MERRKAENLSDVIYRFLRLNGLETPLAQHRLMEAWEVVAGPLAYKLTRELYIKNQTLVVRLSSAVMRNELSLKRAELVKSLNEKAGSQVIVDIHFR